MISPSSLLSFYSLLSVKPSRQSPNALLSSSTFVLLLVPSPSNVSLIYEAIEDSVPMISTINNLLLLNIHFYSSLKHERTITI